jgi:flagellar motility protein MotE (MotC chaperone)
MKKSLPLILCVLALLGGGLAGPLWFWTKAATVVVKVAAQRQLAAQKARAQTRSLGWDFWTVEIENLSSELKEEKARLSQRADDLDRQEKRIAAEKQELERIRDDVAGLRRQIDERVIAINADESKNLHVLAQTYATLTPEGAVNILKEMDDTTAVKILSLMKPDVVGPIFEVMAKPNGADTSMAQHAAELSEKLRMMKAGTAASPVTSN